MFLYDQIDFYNISICSDGFLNIQDHCMLVVLCMVVVALSDHHQLCFTCSLYMMLSLLMMLMTFFWIRVYGFLNVSICSDGFLYISLCSGDFLCFSMLRWIFIRFSTFGWISICSESLLGCSLVGYCPVFLYQRLLLDACTILLVLFGPIFFLSF